MIRPTPAELEAAADRAIPDVIAPGPRLLFVGINPGLYSGATGFHFARPGNRFWPAIHRAGLTPRQLRPDETDELLALGIGITNIVNRTTATAAELSADELRAGADRVRRMVERHRPRVVAVLGVSAYRTAFDRPKAGLGRQPDELAGAELWLLPNPSGLNAHYQLPQLVERFRELRDAVERAPSAPTGNRDATGRTHTPATRGAIVERAPDPGGRRTTMPDHDRRPDTLDDEHLAGDDPSVRGGQPRLPIPDVPQRDGPAELAGGQPTARGGQPPLPVPDVPDRDEPGKLAGGQPTVRGGAPRRLPDEEAT